MLCNWQKQLQSIQEPLYLRNIAVLKKYGNSGYQLTQMNVLRNKDANCENYTEKGTVNTEKLQNNIVRSRSLVREYGLCNPWEFFVTLTFNAQKVNRHDLNIIKKSLTQWLRDYRKKTGANVRYLLIPEQHKDGAWHLHGFIMGLPRTELTAFQAGEHLPDYIRNKLEKGEQVYNWDAFAHKFGYVTVEPIRDRERAVNYIMKYITKDLAYAVTKLGAHLFYASQKLNKAQEVKRGTLVVDLPVDFENEYCKKTWFDAQEYNADYLCSCIKSRHDKKEELNNALETYHHGLFARAAYAR